jgi:hypothetical protein
MREHTLRAVWEIVTLSALVLTTVTACLYRESRLT